jgi:hypothetical protein
MERTIGQTPRAGLLDAVIAKLIVRRHLFQIVFDSNRDLHKTNAKNGDVLPILKTM